jgi:CubicO group peptidase (beta-lactamase class C family)
MANLSEIIEREAKETHFSGVVSIKTGDIDVYCNAFGYRDVKNKLPNNIETKFGIAGGTKLFTALGVGQLIDRGQLSLQTTMEEINPHLRVFIGKKATILQLLSHTSGIYDYYDEEEISDFDNYAVEIPWSELTTPSDYYPLFKNKEMKFEPGARYSYSNGGFVFLGIIIERIAEELYRDFITEQVLYIANMSNSGFYAFNDLPANTATGYLRDRQTSNIFNLPIRGGGDGGMYATAADLHSFWKKLFSNSILSQKLTKMYLKTHYSFDNAKGYGCGIYKKLDDSAFSIIGGDAGVGFFSRYYGNSDTIVSVLSNTTNGEESIVKCIVDTLESGS